MLLVRLSKCLREKYTHGKICQKPRWHRSEGRYYWENPPGISSMSVYLANKALLLFCSGLSFKYSYKGQICLLSSVVNISLLLGKWSGKFVAAHYEHLGSLSPGFLNCDVSPLHIQHLPGLLCITSCRTWG